jgi:hypothetical protein
VINNTQVVSIEREKPAISFIQSFEHSYLDPVPFDKVEIGESSDGAKTALILPLGTGVGLGMKPSVARICAYRASQLWRNRQGNQPRPGRESGILVPVCTCNRQPADVDHSPLPQALPAPGFAGRLGESWKGALVTHL